MVLLSFSISTMGRAMGAWELFSGVNALYRAFSISTKIYNLAKQQLMCQCPLSGFFHFYAYVGFTQELGSIECQCPLTGFFHFYTICRGTITINFECQCPLSGFLHFYAGKYLDVLVKDVCVNALYRAFSISTNRRYNYEKL